MYKCGDIGEDVVSGKNEWVVEDPILPFPSCFEPNNHVFELSSTEWHNGFHTLNSEETNF